jgi:hypothetical protein
VDEGRARREREKKKDFLVLKFFFLAVSHKRQKKNGKKLHNFKNNT